MHDRRAVIRLYRTLQALIAGVEVVQDIPPHLTFVTPPHSLTLFLFPIFLSIDPPTVSTRVRSAADARSRVEQQNHQTAMAMDPKKRIDSNSDGRESHVGPVRTHLGFDS